MLKRDRTLWTIICGWQPHRIWRSVLSFVIEIRLFVQQIHTLVLIRHGESQWNIENRFTGWVDVPLAPSGVAESHRASAEIKKENLEFDICYTSTLKRAIKTCWNILEDLDVMHTPVVQDWRLNERMYGALQGETPMRLHAQPLLVDPLEAPRECLLPIAWTTNVALQHATRAYSIYESKQPEDASTSSTKMRLPHEHYKICSH